MSTKKDRLDLIKDVRAQNNDLWMQIVRIALEHAPEKTRNVMKLIHTNDEKVLRLWSGIANEHE